MLHSLGKSTADNLHADQRAHRIVDSYNIVTGRRTDGVKAVLHAMKPLITAQRYLHRDIKAMLLT